MPNDMRQALVPNAPSIDTDGTIRVPSGPGLGVEVAVDALHTFAPDV